MRNYSELTFKEKKACISLYAKEALTDEDWVLRLKAFRILGFTEKALEDKDEYIRLEAYRALGFTKEALEDSTSTIRIEAKMYLEIKNS